MPQDMKLVVARDFTGGLNLAGDRLLLAPNESPDMLNVDVGIDGGFQSRDGVVPFGDMLPPFQGISNLVPFQLGTASGVWAQPASGAVATRVSSGGAWSTPTGAPNVYTTLQRGAVHSDRLYLAWDGNTGANRRYDGSNVVGVGTAWNDDLGNPTPLASVGNVPASTLVAAHAGSLWVADTTESGVRYRNRVRWSHPGHPEDWVSYHYIDIDVGHDGDVITALVPFQDHLLVFKRHSVHAIYGTPPEGLSVVNMMGEVGTPCQESVVATDVGVFWFDETTGVWGWDGKRPSWLFRNLESVLRTKFAATAADKVRLGWFRSRLWVSVPYASNGGETFVYDPRLGRRGAWTRYSLLFSSFATVQRANNTPLLLGLIDLYPVELHKPVGYDQYGPPNDSSVIPKRVFVSRYVTRWFDSGQPAVRKRWKRPEVVAAGNTNAAVEVTCHRDYDPTEGRSVGQLGGTVVAGTDLVWTIGVWDDDLWSRDDGAFNRIDRLSPLGSARAVALKFTGPSDGTAWGVDAVTFKFIPRRVRS